MSHPKKTDPLKNQLVFFSEFASMVATFTQTSESGEILQQPAQINAFANGLIEVMIGHNSWLRRYEFDYYALLNAPNLWAHETERNIFEEKFKPRQK